MFFKPTPLALIITTILISAPSFAKSSFGGIIYTDVYSIKKDSPNNSGGVASNAQPDADNYQGIKLELPNTSRMRAAWSNEDNLGMYIEFGFGGASGATSVGLRQGYGTYQINDRWQVLAGHTTTPLSPLFPHQLLGNNAPASASDSPVSVGGSHNTGKGYGDLDSGRHPQVRLTYILPSQRGAIALALLDPNQGKALELPSKYTTKPARETTLPRVDLGAALNLGTVKLFPSASYQQQSYNGVQQGSDDNVTTWATSLGVQTAQGPFELSAEYNIGENWRQAGYSLGNSAATLGSGAVTVAKGTSAIQTTESQSYWIDLGLRMSSGKTSSVLHVIYGQMTSQTSLQQAKHQSDMMGVSWPIELPWIIKGLTIRPEVFIYDEGTSEQSGTKTSYGKEVLGGVQMQYTF
jgi:hypothetical protein